MEFQISMIPRVLLVLCMIASAHSACLPGCSEKQCCIKNKCVEKHTGKCNIVGKNADINPF